MLERWLGFLALTEMRRLARSPRFALGRTGLAAVAASLAWAQASTGKPNVEATASAVAAAALLAILLGGPLLIVTGFEQLRSTGTLELLRAAGTSRIAIVGGILYGRLLSLLLFAAGGVGALSALFVHGGLEFRLLLHLAAFLVVAAVSATALALPAATMSGARRWVWWWAFLPPLLLHLAPNLLGSVLSLLGEVGAALGVVDDPAQNLAMRWLLPPTSALVTAGAWTLIPEIVGPAAFDPAAALWHCARLHVPLAAGCFAWACWKLGREGHRGFDDGRRWPTLAMDDDDPIHWHLSNYPRRRWWTSVLVWTLAGGLAFGALVAAHGGNSRVWFWTHLAWLAGLIRECVRAAMSLSATAPLPRLLLGTPSEPEALLRAVDRRGRTLPLALATFAALVSAYADGFNGMRTMTAVLELMGLSVATWVAVGMAVYAGAGAETRSNALSGLLVKALFGTLMLGPVLGIGLFLASAAMEAPSPWAAMALLGTTTLALAAIVGGVFHAASINGARSVLRRRMYPASRANLVSAAPPPS